VNNQALALEKTAKNFALSDKFFLSANPLTIKNFKAHKNQQAHIIEPFFIGKKHAQEQGVIAQKSITADKIQSVTAFYL